MKGMTALTCITDAIMKNVTEIKGGKVLTQEAIFDSLSLFVHANTELNTRQKESSHKTRPAF